MTGAIGFDLSAWPYNLALLVSIQEFMTIADAAGKAWDHLGHQFLDVARQAKVGLRELSAVSGLHHSTIRSMIQRAIGPSGLLDGWVQQELPIAVELGSQVFRLTSGWVRPIPSMPLAPTTPPRASSAFSL